MTPRLTPRFIHISRKARDYAYGNRTDLTDEEIRQLVQERRWVYLATTNLDFMLVWDHRRHAPIILLIAQGHTHDTVVSIWEAHYRGIPGGNPTAIQTWFAWRCSLASPHRQPQLALAS